MLLRQPYIYGEKLSPLNESFPLSLQKESRQVISLPVVDRQSVDTVGPASGRFLQSSPVGALSVSNKSVYEGRMLLTQSISQFDESVKERNMYLLVDVRMIEVTHIHVPDKLVWCSPDGIAFQEYTALSKNIMYMRGQYIYVKKVGTTGNMSIAFYGYR